MLPFERYGMIIILGDFIYFLKHALSKLGELSSRFVKKDAQFGHETPDCQPAGERRRKIYNFWKP